jgi:hypothetical protein
MPTLPSETKMIYGPDDKPIQQSGGFKMEPTFAQWLRQQELALLGRTFATRTLYDWRGNAICQASAGETITLQRPRWLSNGR